MHGSVFLEALIYLVAGILFVPLAKRLGLGSVLGYFIAGIVIGPFVFGFVGQEGEDIMHFAEFGVVMMLFLIGLELDTSHLWKLRSFILGLGGLQVAGTAALVAGGALALGLDWRQAIALGLILSMSSTAIVLQTMKEKGLMGASSGQNAFSVLLFQDIAVIPILAIFPLLSQRPPEAAGPGDHSTNLIAHLPGYVQALAVLAAVAVVVVVGRTLVRPLMRLVAGTHLRELFTAAALLIVVAVTVLMSLVGLSPALGTFVAGVILASSEYRHELESDVEPFKGLLLGLFFMAVGASVNFSLIQEQPGLVAGLVAAVIAVKILALWVLGKTFKMSTDQNLIFTFALSQVGEFAFVLLNFGQQEGVLPTETTGLMMLVVALSMASTPLLLLLNERLLLPRLGVTETPDGRESDNIEEKNPVIIAGFGRFGNIVGRFLKANGVHATVLDNDSDRVELLRKMGLKVYYGDATRFDLLKSAGADDAKIIVIALDTPEKCLELVETVKKHYPHLHILTRTYDRPDTYDMLDAGVLHIYRETLDTSLRLGTDALRLLGFRAYHAQRAAQSFLKHDEANLKHLASVRDDRDEYISSAREKILELELALRSDMADKGTDGDGGWDATTLRREFGGEAATALPERERAKA